MEGLDILPINYEKLGNLEELVCDLGGHSSCQNLAKEVWTIAIESGNASTIDNITYSVLFDKLQHFLMKEHTFLTESDFDIDVNCCASSFSVLLDGDWVAVMDESDYEEFLDLVEELGLDSDDEVA